MSSQLEERVIGLAGMMQAIELVHQIATTGEVDERFYQTSVHSLLQIDAPDAAAVYDGLSGVRKGLETTLRVIGDGRAPHRAELFRYIFGILYLERKLNRRPEMLASIRTGLERCIRQAEHFEPTHPTVIGNLASVYTDTLSTMRFRIYVRGEKRHLENSTNIDKVRALLLAAIRGAVLWRQKGGRNYHLMFFRGKVLKTARSLLEQFG